MCGIAGVISWDVRWPVDRPTLERMAACIAHRGPDARGLWLNHQTDPAVALAHHRLKVIDLDPRADQPFTDHQGRWIVFNGEIYNFRELRRELAHPWRTESDTEVLLAAYAQWGEKFLDRLNGMFAFAIWDEKAHSIFLARDRMGQKPLYFTLLGGRDNCRGVAFASELAALRHSPGFDPAIDPLALDHYLRWGYIPAPRTIYASAGKLLPGSWMRLNPENAAFEQFFDPNEPESDAESTETVAETRRLITQSVRRQLVADVPLGCFLSGGIDSSIIAACMAASVEPGQRVMTFSIGFDDPRYDETRHAQEVAHHLRTQHRSFTVRPDAAADLPKLAAVFGEPFGDSSALPTHYLARETRRHVTVALSGDGGDELFAGYDRYRAMLMAQAFDQMPARLRQIALGKLASSLPETHAKHPVKRLKRLLTSLEMPPAERYDAYMRLFDDGSAAALTGRKDCAWLKEEFERLADGRDVVETALALDRVTYLPGDLLFKVDACSMLHALEVRSPFMDHELVHFAASLSSTDLLGSSPTARAFMQSPMNSPGKGLLRAAFARDLPASVFRRRKMGFAVPIGEWLKGELRPMAQDLLFSPNSFASNHLRRDAVQALLDEHVSGRRDHAQRLYALLMLELWWAARG